MLLRLVVGVLGILQGVVQAVLVVGGTLSTGRNGVDDAESNGVNTILQNAENSSNGLGEGSQAQQAVLANNGLQQCLVDLDELLGC